MSGCASMSDGPDKSSFIEDDSVKKPFTDEDISKKESFRLKGLGLNESDIQILKSMSEERKSYIIKGLEKAFEKARNEEKDKEEVVRIMEQIRLAKDISKDGVVEFRSGTILLPARYEDIEFPPTTINGHVTYRGTRRVMVTPPRSIELGNFKELKVLMENSKR